jgi:hypothetical protein
MLGVRWKKLGSATPGSFRAAGKITHEVEGETGEFDYELAVTYQVTLECWIARVVLGAETVFVAEYQDGVPAKKEAERAVARAVEIRIRGNR